MDMLVWWRGCSWRHFNPSSSPMHPPPSMAASALPSRTFHDHRRHSPVHPPSREAAAPCCLSRRRAAAQLLLSAGFLTAVSSPPPPPALAGKRGRRTVPPEDYSSTPDGLKYYDLVEGKGPTAEKGSTVQPYVFTVGSLPGNERKRDFADNANGLYSAQASPKPPPAMYMITEGMKVGGKRRVIVPPELGYAKKGAYEIPPNASFELNIELLQVIPPAEN